MLAHLSAFRGKKLQEPEEVEDSCELECKRTGFRFQKFFTKTKLPKFQIEGDGHQEFIAPVKVVLVTAPKREYWKKIVGAAFVVLAYFAIGATVIPMFFYSFSYTERLYYNHTNATYVNATHVNAKQVNATHANATHNNTEIPERDTLMSLHVLLFTAGFQMLVPVAFLTVNIYNGAATFLEKKHKKMDYVVIKVISLTCVFGGLLSAMSSKSMSFFLRVWTVEHFSIHGGIGVMAVFLSVVDIAAVCCFHTCNARTMWPKFSLVLCIPSFIASTVCFITSLSKPSFLGWLPSPKMVDFFTFFCLFYTIFCIWNPITNLRCGAK